MERHFHCTACGKCCHGWLPLSLIDALANAGRFPLAMILTTVRQGARAYDITARQGTTIPFGKRKKVAVQISPTGYLPPSFSCPALREDGRCDIHDEKPLRCRTMPFSPYRDEKDQISLLLPKEGWLCDVSAEAPVVYREKGIVERNDFDAERRVLVAQAEILRAYVDALVASAPNVAAGLDSAARKASGGYVVLNFTTVLPRLDQIDTTTFAKRQIPVLNKYARRTADDPDLKDYHRYYSDNANRLERYLARKT